MTKILPSSQPFPFLLLTVGYALIAGLTIALFDGTGDAGDSVHHYLFARYAPHHAELFFDHWAKPVFVLLAAPFAQFGMIGVKVFNALVMLGCVLLTYKTADKWGMQHPWIAGILVIFAPLAYTLTFSGLTEPLFALFLVAGVYLASTDRMLAASMLISFHPFVRSEGLIFLGVFGVYFLLKRQWKVIPWLATGHVVYSVAGYIVYHDILWVFNKIPYAHLSSHYGSGKLLHYVDQLYYVVGLPIYGLMVLGLIGVAWWTYKRKANLELQVLVALGFLGFLVAHTLFWYLGIFNSMGLKRVFVGVIPLIALLGLTAFNLIQFDWLKAYPRIGQILLWGLLAYTLIFPFTANPAAVNWEQDMQLVPDQHIADRMATYLSSHYPEKPRYFFAHPYLGEALQVDLFDPAQRLPLTLPNLGHLQPEDVIIWDSWFAPVEHDVTREVLEQLPELHALHADSAYLRGRLIEMVVFQKR